MYERCSHKKLLGKAAVPSRDPLCIYIHRFVATLIISLCKPAQKCPTAMPPSRPKTHSVSFLCILDLNCKDGYSILTCRHQAWGPSHPLAPSYPRYDALRPVSLPLSGCLSACQEDMLLYSGCGRLTCQREPGEFLVKRDISGGWLNTYKGL
jgi:hypothetical protein